MVRADCHNWMHERLILNNANGMSDDAPAKAGASSVGVRRPLSRTAREAR